MYVYYGKLHKLDANSSTIPSSLEELVAIGAEGYAALEWSSFATNRVNVGGAEVWRHYQAGAERGWTPSSRAWPTTGAALERGIFTARRSRATAGRPTWAGGRRRGRLPMRTLTSTLRAAQEEASGTPHVRVEALDHIAGAPRPTLTRLYAGRESDFYHDATCPADGSLVRARVTPESGRLYVQRVANPGPSGAFSSWALINVVSNASSISLVSRGATVNLFYVNASRRNLFRRESTDYGATWNSPVHVVYPQLSGIAWLAAAVSDIGGLVLFFASTNHDVYVTRKTGTSWSAPSLWPHNVASITGMSCLYHDDWNLVITGTERSTNDAKVWTCLYGAGGDQATNTWSSLREVNTFKANSLTTFRFPSMVRPDVFRMVCTEKSTGSPAFERPVRSHSLTGSSFSDSLWREPIPFDLSPAYGVALAANRR